MLRQIQVLKNAKAMESAEVDPCPVPFSFFKLRLGVPPRLCFDIPSTGVINPNKFERYSTTSVGRLTTLKEEGIPTSFQRNGWP